MVCVQGGLSPLMMCCEQGDSEMAKLLLDSQANPNLQQSVEYHSLPYQSEIAVLDVSK